MSTVVLVARLALVGVFALAGVAKLFNLVASSEAVEGFGVPRHLAKPIGVALPFAEIAVAIALLPTPSARWAAIGAAALLVTFSAGVARALNQGVAPDCNCFGQVASEPVSAKTLVRNAILAALALLIAVAGPGSGLGSWTTNRSAADILAALAVVTAGVLATIVYARRGATVVGTDVAASIHASTLEHGTPAPAFELSSLDGASVSLSNLLARGRPVVLVFASPSCAPCLSLLPHLARWNRVISNDLTLVIVESTWQGHEWRDDQRSALEGLITLTEPNRRVAEAYGAPATPCAISMTADGLISSDPMPGSSQVERLIRQALETAAMQPVAVSGAAPA